MRLPCLYKPIPLVFDVLFPLDEQCIFSSSTHTQILLLSDEGELGSERLAREVAKVVGVNESTVFRLRQRCVEEGLEAALERKPRTREKSRVLDGDGEAHLVATMCSDPPSGQSRVW